jgi:sulfatase modifying factor 1
VTRGQYANFMTATGRTTIGCWHPGPEKTDITVANWRSPGYPQTDDDPVVYINYDYAKAYTAWLSHQTGNSYRLPSEAEWEYAARANTRTPRFWGANADEACGFANVHDRTSKRVNKFDWSPHNCDDGHDKTAPVGKFRANAFGLHDMLGNVWEWVEDCWNENYVGAPSDTNAWVAGDCSHRVLRGGSWTMAPVFVRSSSRGGNPISSHVSDNGFRVARILP